MLILHGRQTKGGGSVPLPVSLPVIFFRNRKEGGAGRGASATSFLTADEDYSAAIRP